MDELQQQYTETVDSPFYDSLTGLYNYGFFQLTLEREINLSERNGNTFTFILVDIDDFSLINKQVGVAQGDRILKNVGKAIRKTLREVDVAAHYKADIFAIILADANECSLRHPMERLLKEVANSVGQRTTVSAGVVVCPDDAHTHDVIMAKSRKALKRAKLQGGNSYVIAGGEDPEVKKESPVILVVDDEPLNTKLLEAILKINGFQVLTASSGEETLKIIDRQEIDLVLLDIMMPGMNGYEVCRTLKSAEETSLIPIVMITALDDMDARVKSIDLGADDFLTKPPDTVELLARVRSLVRVKTLNENLTSIENVLCSFANAVESKDKYTVGHVSRVAELADRLGKRLRCTNQQLRSLRIGGMLHDLGKISVNDAILNKKGPLNDEEWEIMRQHPIVGEKITMPLQQSMGVSLDIIRHHHEKLDGSGYPDGLVGDEISLPVRIMTIVDIYDSLSIDRSYRKGMPVKNILSLLEKDAEQGKLDSHLVAEFIAMVREQGEPQGKKKGRCL